MEAGPSPEGTGPSPEEMGSSVCAGAVSAGAGGVGGGAAEPLLVVTILGPQRPRWQTACWLDARRVDAPWMDAILARPHVMWVQVGGCARLRG